MSSVVVELAKVLTRRANTGVLQFGTVAAVNFAGLAFVRAIAGFWNGVNISPFTTIASKLLNTVISKIWTQEGLKFCIVTDSGLKTDPVR